MHPFCFRIRFRIALGALALVLASCREQPITHYRVSKEDAGPRPAAPAPAAAAMPADSPAIVTAQDGPALAWKAPEHWVSGPASSMRRATYSFNGDETGGAELAVTTFPGDVGGELANVNRWRGQLGLAPASAEEQAAAIERLTVGSFQIAVVDLTSEGTPAARLLGAIVPVGEATWFFKFTGSPTVIEQEKAGFMALLNSLHPKEADDACCATGGA